MNLQKMRKIRKMTLQFALVLFANIFVCAQVSAQSSVSGVVTDETGETVIGATVTVKGTTVGTATDIDGKFSLSAPADSKTLVVSYIGMKTQEVAIGSGIVNVVLREDVSVLDEVVVIGYGTMKKRDLTGSVSSVGEKALGSIPVATAAEAITGRLAGVQVTTTEGSPDAEISIRVRGGGSITQSNEPLYIVDGFPVNTISDIPPSDIESIDVLKDASTTAIYGSRGANGVIIVTTKSGKSGKIQVNYNAYYGWKKIANTLDVLDPSDYLNWQYELALLKDKQDSYEKYFGPYQDMDLYSNAPANDWQDQIYGRTGHVFNHNLSITGGSDIMKYSFSYAHVDDKAIMYGSDYKRDNLSLKLNHKPSKRVSLDYSARYSQTKIGGAGMNEQNEKSTADSRMKHTVIYSPIPMASVSGGDEEENQSNLVNPYTAITDSDRFQKRTRFNLDGSFTWEIIDDLKLRTELGLNHYVAEDDRFYGISTYHSQNNGGGLPILTLSNITTNSFRNSNTINYDFKKVLKSDSHHLNVLLGEEMVITKKHTLASDVRNFPKDFTFEDTRNLAKNGTPVETDNSFAPDDKLLSFFGRVNYDFLDKYLLSVTFRADGSSKFAEGNRWGYFPSAAAAWRISDEGFMDGTKDWLNDLKLRLSFGTAGNNNIPSGQISQTFSPGSGTQTAWIGSNFWAASKVMANPDLKWETTYTRNVGLDFTLLKNRLYGSVDAYLNNTKDLLIDFPVSGTGYDTQYRNMGETENKGFEVQLTYVAIDKADYGLDLNFNIGFNKNKIKSLGGVMNDFGAQSEWASSEIGVDYMVAVGNSVGQIYGYVSDGRYELSDFKGYDEATKKWILNDGVADASSVVGTIRPGTLKIKDISGEDGKVTIDDRKIIGNTNPTHTGGFNINGRAYGFDLSAAFNWSVGNDVYNANKVEYTQSGKYQYRNMITEMASGKRWTNLTADGQISNDPAVLAELNANTTMWSPYTDRFVFTDWAVEDGSFLRLNTLTLGYTLPKALLSKVSISNLRFYVSAYNVFCLTSYSGFDPEVSTRRKTGLTPGVDYSAYPKSRQFLVGMNLNF